MDQHWRLHTLCGLYLAPQYSIPQTSGLVTPSLGYAAELSEEHVAHACIYGHQRMRISVLAYVPNSRLKLYYTVSY